MASQSRKKSNLINPEELKNRGKRIKYLRKILRYSSAKAFGEKCGIVESTFKSWEQGRHTGLTTNGALKIVEECQKEGVPCTLEWLLYGKGSDPVKSNTSALTLTFELDSINIIQEELKIFHRFYSDAIDTIINDKGMEPCFSPGDHVAGIRYFEKDIPKLIGLNCIVQLHNGQLLVRKLLAGEKAEHYTLSCINPTIKENISKNVRLFSAAYIIWIRKPELQ